jgi:LPXTG-site transpeptidase (sortase) family protein
MNLSRFFIFLGLACYIIAGYYIWLRNDPNRLKFNNYAHAQNISEEKKKFPARITIDDLGVDLPVEPSSVVNNKWETTGNGVSYLLSSPIPGNDGNSIIYGHNWANLFGPLVNIETGTEVVIEYSDKTKKTFVIEYTSVVEPNQSSILAPSNDKRITLYTCTGFLDSKRFVAVAILK